MSQHGTAGGTSADLSVEALTQELLSTQLALGENVANISQFMKTTLTVIHANLRVIQGQLIRIQELTAAIEAKSGFDN
ncbi:hypothetical protein LJC63_08885 [Ruminococcaceae bacterium OttesenSCG-928-L11]|nr:hypothetical protein [Ruminococcaceae bacterium OttesenSCG-928-L11]